MPFYPCEYKNDALLSLPVEKPSHSSRLDLNSTSFSSDPYSHTPSNPVSWTLSLMSVHFSRVGTVVYINDLSSACHPVLQMSVLTKRLLFEQTSKQKGLWVQAWWKEQSRWRAIRSNKRKIIHIRFSPQAGSQKWTVLNRPRETFLRGGLFAA